MRMNDTGILYLVGTPIGNLKDITLRALEILSEVDMIAAEDTRHSKRLLEHYEIKKPLISYHQHNAKGRAELLVQKMLSGENIAVISDAGMPGISDPGYWVVKEAIENKVTVCPIPGPSAAISALVVSGLSTDRFIFEGFLPRKKEELKRRLESLSHETRTIVIYEAPHRIKQTLRVCEDYFGLERHGVVARELTKKFEEIRRGTLAELSQYFSERQIKGEFCLLIEGAEKIEVEKAEWWNVITEREHVDLLISRGLSTNDAIKEAAKTRNKPKREIYNDYHQET